MSLLAVPAARHFLSVVWEGDPPTDVQLLEALDQLALSYHAVAESWPKEDAAEPPREDQNLLRQQVCERFLDYGFYACADPLDVYMTKGVMIADAIDDLVDLTNDMREVVWRADNLGEEDALCFFRTLYFHWGDHLRSLSNYLHARQFNS